MALTSDIIDKDRGWRPWGAGDLYDKITGTGFVPNPTDWIYHPDTNIVYKVLTVNYSEPSWTVELLNGIPLVNDGKPLGGHYPLRSDKFRVYVDTTKNPATMTFDKNVTWNGADLEGIRIFRGTDITDSGEILSGSYKDGRLDKTYLPLQAISNQGADTVVKQALPGACLAAVEHGDMFSFVVYDDVGNGVAMGSGYIIKTNLVMALETPARTILNIKLVSPFISGDDSSVLTLPINMPLESIPLWCEVQYNDGVKTLAVDGSRVKLNGLRNSGAHDTFYISSNAGNELPLTLSYQLAKGESYAGDNLVDGKTIVKDYTAVTEAVDGAYSMKLFVVPVWLDSTRGVRLQYLLYNLTRGTVYDATAQINYTGGSSFDPTLYGVKQRLNVQCDISKVNTAYRPYTHPQSFSITLMNPGTEKDTNFVLEYLPNGLKYGEKIWAEFKYSNVTYSELDVSCQKTSKAEWLAALYDPIYPLFDRRNEDGPPTPTHFQIHIGGNIYTYEIDDWMAKKVINYKVGLDASLVIRWLRRTPTDELQLGATPMLAHHIE
ncbi:putative virion structural protein [Erwinia phage Wellington]|uniref:Putative virion structural protein n=1 Tax=Erwinia phage Wellington TaxID=2267653 RepID=A0A345BLT9_9CAUD|nr:virion structural protein [Erwinia phage Wellington]AXF51410.1 putative virion structural protein [Erwinia phage Wellington]